MASFLIILPCYNPHPGWKEVIRESMERIRKKNQQHSFRVTLVNDGSQKGFDKGGLENIEGLTIIELPVNMGKGYALRKGLEQSYGSDYYIYTDVDFPYTEESFQLVIDELGSGKANVVAGVRDDNYYKDVPAARKNISIFLRWMIKKMLLLQITDTQCGLKGFDIKGRQIFLNTTIHRFLFDLEFIFLASNNKTIVLIPVKVDLKENIVFSEVNMRILFKESTNFLKVLLYSLTGKK
jgi:hypothetical protein